MVLPQTARPPVASGGASAPASTGAAAGGYYTAEQAARGRMYFYGACATCHIANTKGATQADLVAGRGFLNGRGLSLLNVASNAERFADRWHTPANLFNKIRTTMPGHDAGGLSEGAYVDIAAYIVQANGQPAGRTKLPDDLAAMRAMPLLEAGFEPVFNGRDFSGLKFLLGANCEPKPAGCRKTDAGSTLKIESGTVVCSGRPYGYMYIEKTYLNFTLRLDFRYTPIEGMESDDEFFGNNGYLLFIAKHQVWPQYIEIQGANAGLLSMISTGAKAVFTVDNEADARRTPGRPMELHRNRLGERPGEVVAERTLVSTVSEHEYQAGHIGFQSEGSEIRWRNIRIKAN